MKLSLNKIVTFLTLLIAVSYTGVTAGYKACIILSFGLIVLFLFSLAIKQVKLNRKNLYSPCWIILFGYLCFNGLLSFPRSALYIILFCAGLLIMYRKMDAVEIEHIISFFKGLAIVLAFSIYVQAFLPSIFYPFAQKWFYYSTQYSLLYNLGAICGQYSGIFFEVSQAGFVLSIGSIICFIQASLERTNRYKNYIFFVFIYFAIILTGKRSLILIVAGLLLIFELLNSFEHLSPIKTIVLLCIFSLLITQIDTIFEIVDKILTKGGNTVALSGRGRFWQLAFEMFKDNPILGKGINIYDVYFNHSGIRSLNYDFAGAHNSYIQLLAETGIIGTFLYVAGLLQCFVGGIKEIIVDNKKKLLKKSKYMNIVTFILLLILAYALSENPFYMPQQVITLFLVMGMLTNLKNINDKDLPELRKSKIRFTFGKRRA